MWLSRVFNMFKDIKFVIGVISTAMFILSAFRYEVIYDDGMEDNYGDQQTQQQQPGNVTTIDKKALDALSKFDRNVRHLLIKGKEASKYDFMNVLPDFKEAIEQATKVLNELQKLNLNTNYNCKDSRKKEYRKKEKKFAGKDRTLSFSFRLGSHIYKLSLYWPKLVRLFIGDDD